MIQETHATQFYTESNFNSSDIDARRTKPEMRRKNSKVSVFYRSTRHLHFLPLHCHKARSRAKDSFKLRQVYMDYVSCRTTSLSLHTNRIFFFCFHYFQSDERYDATTRGRIFLRAISSRSIQNVPFGRICIVDDTFTLPLTRV